MKIHASQFDHLLQQDPQTYVEQTLAVVRQNHPTYRQSDDMLRDSIRAGIKRARGHGLTTDQLVMEYVLIMFEMAPNFDQHPKIARTLAYEQRPAAERWERIFAEDFDPVWDEVAAPGFYDGSYWHDPDAPPPAPAGDVSADDWAELVVGLRQAQGPGPYPPASRDDLQQAKVGLTQALARRRERTPEQLEAEARDVAARLREAGASSTR
jgi:hypothetical protein